MSTFTLTHTLPSQRLVNPSDAPTIFGVTATNPQSQDVKVAFQSSEQLGSNASDLSVEISGAESDVLARSDFTESGTGPYTYEGTYTGSSDGDYTATIQVAKDPQGNDGANGQNNTVTVDTTAPTISNVTLQNDGSDNLDFSFQSDEKLGSNSSDIKVTVDGPNTNDVYSFDRSNFSETGNGPYTYELKVTQGYNDGDGRYTAAVDDAIDPFGNDGADGSQTDDYGFNITVSFQMSASTTQPTDSVDLTIPHSELSSGKTVSLLADGSDTNEDFLDDTNNNEYTLTYTPSASIGSEVDLKAEVDGSGAQSNVVTITIEEAPDPVTDLTASGGDQQVTLDWTADDTVEGDILRYEVHESQTPGFDPNAGDSTLVATITNFTEGQSISETLTGRTNGTTYLYEVIAVDADGFTADSNEASATPSAPAPQFRFTVDPTDTNNAATASGDFRLPLEASGDGGIYDFTVNWGDGTSNQITSPTDADKTHTYSNPSNGPFEIVIEGTVEGFSFYNGVNGSTTDKSKIRDVKEWGPLVMLNGRYGADGAGNQFKNCANLTISATDAPDLSGVQQFSGMFQSCDISGADFSSWDTSNGESADRMFQGTNFNGGFGGSWTFSNFKSALGMFQNSAFTGANANPNSWDVSSVTNSKNSYKAFEEMFSNTDFDADISNWDITGLQDVGSSASGRSFAEFALYGTAFSTSNYDALLEGWSTLADNNPTAFPNGCTLEINASYTGGGSVASARNNLINNYGWTFNDNGTV